MFGFNLKDTNRGSIDDFNSIFIKPSQKNIIERRNAEDKEKEKEKEKDIEYLRNKKGDRHAKHIAAKRLYMNPDLIKEKMVLNDIIQKQDAARIAAEKEADRVATEEVMSLIAARVAAEKEAARVAAEKIMSLAAAEEDAKNAAEEEVVSAEEVN